jgi:hypothetical protein
MRCSSGNEHDDGSGSQGMRGRGNCFLTGVWAVHHHLVFEGGKNCCENENHFVNGEGEFRGDVGACSGCL